MTTAPYEWLYSHKDNRFVLKQFINRMSAQAKSVGVNNLTGLFNAYVSSLKTKGQESIPGGNRTDFTGQEMELDCGSWEATDEGIFGTDKVGFPITACYHPIMPVQRLVNIDTNIHKIKIAYSLGRRWNYIIEDRSVISDSRAIIGLSKYGIAVNSENAKYLVRYLSEVDQMNYDLIPEVSSVGRLGWIDDYGFSPYAGDLVFDGEEEYRTRFESIRFKGDRQKWIDCCKTVRAGKTKGSVIARIMLAASFASALVKPCNCLPFFVHLWGGREAMSRVKDGNVRLSLGVKVYRRHVVEPPYGVLDGGQEHLPHGLLVLELYLSLGRMYVYVDVLGVDVEVDEIWNLLSYGQNALVGGHYGLVEIRMLHIAPVDEEVLVGTFLARRLWLADEARDAAYRGLHAHRQQVGIEFLAEDVDDALAQVAALKVERLHAVAVEGEVYAGINQGYALEGSENVVKLGGVRLEELPPRRHVVEYVFNREVAAHGARHRLLPYNLRPGD